MKHLVFIGRWCPLHAGHKAIIRKVYEEKQLPVLIMIRNTEESIPLKKRVDIIQKWLKDSGIRGSVVMIPDIEGIYYGRGVGYNIQQIDSNIPNVSGTEIREHLENNNYREVYEAVIERKPIHIPIELFEKVEEKIESTSIKDVEEYVEILLRNEFVNESHYTENEEALIRERLRRLGYIE